MYPFIDYKYKCKTLNCQQTIENSAFCIKLLLFFVENKQTSVPNIESIHHSPLFY